VSVVYLLFLAWKIANAAPVRYRRLAVLPESAGADKRPVKARCRRPVWRFRSNLSRLTPVPGPEESISP
jgi:hypothetical protein